MRLSFDFLFACCFLWLFAACSSENDNQLADVGPTDLQVATSISNLRISSITEDADGYIWMATSRGLNRLNGDEFHQYFCNDLPNSIPDNRINDVFCDSKHRVWVSSKNGVARYTENDNFETVVIDGSTLRCEKFVENSRGDLFVLQNENILKYNPENDRFEKAITGISNLDPIIHDIFIDEEDILWCVDDQSVTSYSTTTLNMLQQLDLGPDPQVRLASMIGHQLWIVLKEELRIYDIRTRQWVNVPEVIQANTLLKYSGITSINLVIGGYVVIGTVEGLFLYNPKTDHFYHQSQPEFPINPPSFTVSIALTDSRGNLWLCSESQGYKVYSRQASHFNSTHPFVNMLMGKPVVSLAYDKQQNLWVATKDNGLYSYNFQTGKTQHYDEQSFSSQKNDNIYGLNRKLNSVYVDNNNDIWIASSPRGILHFRLVKDQIQLINTFNIPLPIVMQEDKEGTMWVGCYGNSYFSKRSLDLGFVEHHLFSNTFSFLSCMTLLRDGSFATLMREDGLRFISPETHEQMPPAISDSVLKSCVARNVFIPSALKEGPDGRLWIGTISNGLMCFDRKTGNLQNIKGTPCDDIASMEIDSKGNLWVSTQYGLGKYSPETQKFVNYYSADGLGGNEFYDRSSCQLEDGTLIFGGSHGLTMFKPTDISDATEATIFLEDLKVNNVLIRPGEHTPIDRKLNLCKEINLTHRQNNFSITYSAHDFSTEKRFNYHYMLEGFNHTWVDANASSEAIYANIKPGSYLFRVRITNKDNDNVIGETSIPVIVHASLWNSWWARVIYFLCALFIIISITQLVRGIQIEKRTRLKNQREKEQERRINQMNMNFFVNVNHEFRTPLTVISGPISQLCQDTTFSTEQHRLLTVVNRSVSRMLQLVNQMMDFHKLEDGELMLEVKRQDIVGLLRQVAEFFAVNAHDKNISFRSHGLEDILLMYTDLDKLEKILNNLIGNAMKYTPAGGKVELMLDAISGQEAQSLFPNEKLIPDMQYAKISVIDNGPGIPVTQRNKVFQRFYQLRNAENQTFNWGTGIGLYYTRKLVNLHHGQIGIFDTSDGVGACFCFVLPMGQSAYAETEIVNSQGQSQTALFPLQEQEEEVFDQNNNDQNKPHLVVVDDDVDVIHYLKLLLGKEYRVTCRFDAISALETLRKQEEEVDLVISDVMMPGVTGFQLCQQIKEDEQICHLPVILVTAKTTVKDQIEGLQAGALAYVTKPFDPAYLQALIKRMLGTRDKTRKALQESTQTSALEEDALSAQDKAFMNELYRLMEEELSNPDMDVTRISDLLHISRSKLYYKIKGLTGENPSSFFKTYKLNRAAELIREGKYNFSEISLLTGFSTLSYFSTSFKRHFGVSPSEY